MYDRMFRPNHTIALSIHWVQSRICCVGVCEEGTMHDITFSPNYKVALPIPCVQSRKNSLVPFTRYHDKTDLFSTLKKDQ